MSTSSRHRPSPAAPSRKRAAARLELEPLEDRRLLASGLDLTFAAGGERTNPLSDGALTEWATAVAVQSDGKALLAGPSGDGTSSQFAVVRLNANGTLDTGFGSGGRVRFAFDGAADQRVAGLAIDPATQKILVAGTATTTDGTSANTEFAVARLNTDGSFDAGFSGGRTVIDVGGTGPVHGDTSTTVTLSTVALAADGKMLLSGTRYVVGSFGTTTTEEFVVARLNADGSPDAAFDGDGVVSVAVDAAASSHAGAGAAMALQGDGRIVLAGTSGAAAGADPFNDFTVMRLTPTGQPDTAFGAGGRQTFAFGNNLDNEARAVAIAPDGKIVVGGLSGPDLTVGANTDFAVARLTADGQLDPNFKGGGQTVGFDLGGTKADRINALAVQRDGKILAVGGAVTATLPNTTSGVGSSSHFALARFNGDGSLDQDFGTGGLMQFGFDIGGLKADEALAVALQADGRFVVAGTATVATDLAGTDE